MESNRLTFIATGDTFITRRFPRDGFEGFEEVRDCIEMHDVKFTNLEMTFHNKEGYPAAVSGGTWAMMEPGALDDVKTLGFNLYNTANNHSGDYSEGGVLATIRNMEERDMVFSGTGRNLAEASKACYLETKKSRVALISVASSFSPASRAGGQSEELWGRPGLSPLRFTKYCHVNKEHFAMAQKLADLSYINADKLYSIRTGYLNPFPEGMIPFGDEVMFVLDEEEKVTSEPDERDMKRIEAEIDEARKQADVVLVSFHGHEYDLEDTTVPSMFLETFSRRCIDAGADAVIGHGPHEMRGIEIYKEKPIFYSLGNFLFETETVSLQPHDAYVNKKLPPDMKVGSYMDNRSKNGTVGFGVLPEIWKSIMAAWTMEDGKLVSIQLYPIELGMERKRSQKGTPRMSHNEDTLRELAGLSRPYGTEIRIENGVGYIDL